MLLFLKTYFNNSNTNKTIWLLVIIDILFIIAHTVFVYLIFIRVQFDWSIAELFFLQNDGNIPEIFQYFKYFIIILLILYIIKKRKAIGYVSWLIMFILLLFDDALRFHERFAAWIVEKFNYPPMFGLRAHDLGELTYAGIFGSILLIFIFIEFRYSNKEYKKRCIDLGLLFALFLFFGIAIDMFHEFVGDNRFVNLFMILIEDGGEMITLSFIVWYFLFIVIKPKNHNNYLHQYLLRK